MPPRTIERLSMKYVYNPKNHQINPVTSSTFVDVSLRDKVISAELYGMICKGKVSIEDVAALFAVNKSPEILVKNNKAVKNSPVSNAPDNTAKVEEPEAEEVNNDNEIINAESAFDGRELSSKKHGELMILAGSIGIDVNAEGFTPTRGALIKAILAKAKEAEKAPEKGDK